MRILALDWGTVRIGGAISDPEGRIAFPLEKPINSKNSISEIRQLVQEKQIEKILLGLPKALAGGETDSTKSVRKFAENIKQQVEIPLEFFDERLSSQSAKKLLESTGMAEKEQRQHRDNIAASQMLQAYLDTNKN